MQTVFGYLCAVLYGAACIGIASLLYRLGLPRSYSRKTVHVLIGFEWVILSHFLGAGLHFLLVCILFTAGLLLDYKKSILPSMSSEGENAPGTVYYGVSMTVMALVCLFLPDLLYPFGIAVFCTSFGDGMAAVIGGAVKCHNPKLYGNKTLVGTISCFAFSFLSVWILCTVYPIGLPVYAWFCIALFASEIELLCTRGLDNLFLPLGVFALTAGFLAFPGLYVFRDGHGYWGIDHFLVPILLTVPVIIIVKCKRLLTNNGIYAAILMDITVSLAFGNFGFCLLLSFLAGGALVDRFKARYRRTGDETEKTSSQRDFWQVAANGGVPMLVAVFSIIHSGGANASSVALICYTASVAEAFADTCASGFGAIAKRAYDPFRRRPVTDGLSGGMSLIGTAAALGGALLIAGLAYLMLPALPLLLCLTAAGCAFLGTVFDSFLGSLVQEKFRCRVCGKLTEKHRHCGELTEHASGFKSFNNDVVNFFGSGFSVLLISLLIICFFD